MVFFLSRKDRKASSLSEEPQVIADATEAKATRKKREAFISFMV